MDGILIIDKEAGMTSRDVVNEACKKLKTKKIGHTGTLDPLATGVLVLGVNKGTKIIELLTSDDKEYEAEILVGITTDTGDVTGSILEEEKVKKIDIEELKKALINLTTTYNQTVPLYSAIRINGKRLYEYARENIEVDLPSREITIYSLELIEEPYLENGKYCFKIRTKVSKGTYIRSLIEDIGKYLNIKTTMKNLRRTKQGIFKIEQTIKIDDIEENKIISIKDALSNYDKIIVDKQIEIKVRNGAVIDKICEPDLVLVLNEQEELLAIYKTYEKDNTKMKPLRVFGE